MPGMLPVPWRWLLPVCAALSPRSPAGRSFLQVLTCRARGATLRPSAKVLPGSSLLWHLALLLVGKLPKGPYGQGVTMEKHGDGTGTRSSTPLVESLQAHLPSAVPVSHWCWVLGSGRGRLSPVSSRSWRSLCRMSPRWLGALQFITGVEALEKKASRQAALDLLLG